MDADLILSIIIMTVANTLGMFAILADVTQRAKEVGREYPKKG